MTLPRLDFARNWLQDEQILIGMGVNKSLMVTKITHGYPVQQLRVPDLRTVPTFVTAHTFCASPDTRISYRQCLLIQGYFCAV